MTTLRTLCHIIISFALVVLFTSCGKDSGTSSDTVQPTLTSLYQKVFSQACIECHVPGGLAFADGAQIDFTSQTTAFNTLTTETVQGVTATGTCPNVAIVDASNANGSYLAAVLFEDIHRDDFVVSGCTPYSVHLTDQSISAAEKTALLEWINSGALDN